MVNVLSRFTIPNSPVTIPLAVGSGLGWLEAGSFVGAVFRKGQGAVGTVGAHRLQAPVLCGRGGAGDVAPRVGVGHVPGLGAQVTAEKRIGLANPVPDRLGEPLID